MKRCPSCQSTYTDATLRYCLADGTALIEGDTEEATIVRTKGNVAADTEVMPGGLRVEIPSVVDRTERSHSKAASRPKSSGSVLKIVVAAAVIGLLLIGVIGVAGLIYYNSSGTPTVANNTNKIATPTPTQTPDQTGELRDQIANLEKRLNEQKNANRAANIPQTPPGQNTKAARVDSPSDGFLALRTEPNSETGERILKIPHGSTVQVGECGPVVTPVKRSGRWCRVSYNGYAGWVFDAYLIYSGAKE